MRVRIVPMNRPFLVAFLSDVAQEERQETGSLCRNVW